MDVYKGIEAVILANDSHQFVCSLSLTDVSCEWCSTCPSTLPSWLTGVATVKTAWLFLSSAGLQSDVWVYMRDHDPSDEGTGPQSWTIILTTTQSRNLPSNRCLKPFVEPFGTEPKPTYLHSYLHGNPAAQSFSSSPSFLHPSLASALSLCLCHTHGKAHQLCKHFPLTRALTDTSIRHTETTSTGCWCLLTASSGLRLRQRNDKRRNKSGRRTSVGIIVDTEETGRDNTMHMGWKKKNLNITLIKGFHIWKRLKENVMKLFDKKIVR